MLWTGEIQCAKHMISMRKLRFSSCPRTKVRRHGPPGSAKAQPWYCFYIIVLLYYQGGSYFNGSWRNRKLFSIWLFSSFIGCSPGNHYCHWYVMFFLSFFNYKKWMERRSRYVLLHLHHGSEINFWIRNQKRHLKSEFALYQTWWILPGI